MQNLGSHPGTNSSHALFVGLSMKTLNSMGANSEAFFFGEGAPIGLILRRAKTPLTVR